MQIKETMSTHYSFSNCLLVQEPIMSVQNGTKLSKFIWSQRDLGNHIDMSNIKWTLKTKAIPYRAGNRYCDTCLSETTHIALAEPSEILNSRKEIVNKCPHKRNFKLKFYKPP